MQTHHSLITLASLGLLCTACVVGPRGRVGVIAPVPVAHIYVEREPPPIRYERLPEPPSREHHWVAGHWSWDGRAYVWVPGYYHARPRPSVIWVDGHWERHERGWHWVEGYWR
jgi:hypothetical protein